MTQFLKIIIGGKVMRDNKYKNLINCVMRIHGNKVYYFDESGIYQCMAVEEAKENTTLKNKVAIQLRGRDYFHKLVFETGLHIENSILFKSAVAKMKEGDTLEDLEKYVQETKIQRHPKPIGLDKFIIGIDKPIIQRETGNDNKKTFDFIFVEVRIILNWDGDRRKYIEENMKAIKDRVIKKVSADKSFKKFGVPVNILRLSRVTLRRDNILEFVFELKNISA